jgi:hypothetical protein
VPRRGARPYRGLDLATPRGGASSPARHTERRRIHRRDVLGGLIHELRVGRVTPTIVLEPFSPIPAEPSCKNEADASPCHESAATFLRGAAV